MVSARARKIINSIKPNLTTSPQGQTQQGSAGYDNIRDDIEKTKHLREGTITKTPVNNFDIVNKLYADSLGGGGGGITNLEGGSSNENFGGVAISPIDGGDST